MLVDFWPRHCTIIARLNLDTAISLTSCLQNRLLSSTIAVYIISKISESQSQGDWLKLSIQSITYHARFLTVSLHPIYSLAVPRVKGIAIPKHLTTNKFVCSLKSILSIDMLCVTRLIAFANFLGSLVVAQSSTASFQYPPSSEDLKINYYDAVVVSWTSNFSQAWLYLWCVVGQSTLSCKHCSP